MLEKKFVRFSLYLVVVLSFSFAGARGANILFIASHMDPVYQASDDALIAFMEGLGHTVTYLSEDAPKLDMSTAAAAADVVFISESPHSANVHSKINEIATPMVITECWGWDEMGLCTLTTGAEDQGIDVATTDIEIIAPGHPLAAGLTGTVTVLTDITGDRGTARFSTGIPGSAATVIAQATLSDGATYACLFVYEKGAELAVTPADGSPRIAADIRVCLGFDEQSYLLWNENAYLLLEAAVNFALGIRVQPMSYSPNPANGQTEVPRDTALSWRKGAYAEKHNVYFGTSIEDVNQASVDDPRDVLVSPEQEGTTYDIAGLLEFGQTYYWRVDEVNAPPDSTIYKGDVWSFTVRNFLIVDDFEDYNDTAPYRIFDTWIDGYGVETNGAEVGYADPDWEAGEHFIETSIVNGGKQSMPYFYDNDMRYSEAERPLSGSARDWTRESVRDLSLWFKGYPAYVGSFVEDPAGTYTMTSTGTDIWDNADEFHFAYREVASGAVTIIAKVESLEAINKDTKAGIMIRDSLDAGSVNTALLLTPDPEKGLRFQNRYTLNGNTQREDEDCDPNAMAPYWLKIERTSGGLIRASRSPDGVQWTQFGLKVASMQMPIYIGLAVTSHDVTKVCEAKFSNVSFPNTTVSTQWADQDIGLISNDAEPMYVAVSNSTGDPAVVYHDDPNAVQMDTWTEWIVPLQAFADQGVNLTDIDKVAIGFGTRGDTTTAGGSGTMYFDDIRLYRPNPTE